ncbi:hypothetical protein Bbelb_394170 [Branchiostoma belcheri]|nr:hypothetical protein Bbelb_394170 [Branchiostoma belcheri]
MAEVNRSNWTSAETRCLIGLGNCDRIQSKMETFRKREAFGDIAEGMKQEGYNRTSKQVQKKIRDLKYSYQRIRNSNSRSGRSEFTTCDTARRRPPQLRREAGAAVPVCKRESVASSLSKGLQNLHNGQSTRGAQPDFTPLQAILSLSKHTIASNLMGIKKQRWLLQKMK